MLSRFFTLLSGAKQLRLSEPRARAICLVFASVSVTFSAGSAVQAAAMDAHAIHIELRQDVEARKNQLSLGDVAIVDSPNLQELVQLVNIPLGPAPHPGESVVLSKETLTNWVHIRGGISREQIVWSGPQRMRIYRSAMTVNGAQISQLAQTGLEEKLSRDGQRVNLGLIRTPGDIKVPDGKLELKISPQSITGMGANDLPGRVPPPKHQTVWVDVWVDEAFVRSVPVDFDVNIFAPALVAMSDLQAGQVLDTTATDTARISTKEVSWSGRSAIPVGTTDLPAPMIRMRRDVRAGEPLTKQDIEAAPAVRQGEMATLRVSQSTIQLESKVEALQDGLVGQTIRVKMKNAASSILAEVTGPKTLEIRE